MRGTADTGNSTMNRIDRLTAMILLLQSHRVVTAEKIADHFEISVRTVYRDIVALGEAGVPIVAEAGIGYALMRGYHMPPVMFTEDETAALFMSGELTEQFGDESLKQSMRAAMLKVRGALPTERNDYLGRLSKSVSVSGPFSPGRDAQPDDQSQHLMPAQKAVVNRCCLAIHYNTGARGDITERVIEPLGLVYYARRWHLIGWCRLRGGVRDFRLDRIDALKATGEIFERREDFSVVEYLKHEVDCDQLTTVTMEIQPWILDRVLADMPARMTQRSELADGRIRIEAMAYSLDWLTGWLAAVGTAAQVVSPPKLRRKMRERAQELAAHYAEEEEKEKTPAAKVS